MDTAAFDTLAGARELETAGMVRDLAEVTALNMHKARTAHLDQLATQVALESHRVETKADIADLRSDMRKVGIVIANAAFVVANAGLVIAAVKFL